ncbi:glutathione S-transferase family protein [Pseudoxanthomonas composti]|uniref:Glutathione S-transferase family protein n=1 Tax=Pseudoxanthomonas composti TaxID=2137479 RepID=A0A4Q1JZF6_9GAMM|nr:glutathione S-transferase family protein [Pseudoxanthomonas composti]RXR08547.1 glutathione S-transferase family protein [Pseudoxanthomonas composti]
MSDRHITLFHAIPSRASGVLTLLEELGADYEVKLLDLKAGDNLKPDYLAVNPMGKVPAILHQGALVTEQVAIFIYLGDLYADAGLAPAIGDPLRGPYLRWLAFHGSCFEPALIDKALKREPAPRGMSPFVDADTVMQVVQDQLAAGDYLLGERFTVADVLWGSALGWLVGFGLVQATPEIARYLQRVTTRPAFERARQLDAARAGG